MSGFSGSPTSWPREPLWTSASSIQIARRVAFLLCSAEQALGLPIQHESGLRERTDAILKAAKRKQLDPGLYRWVFTLRRGAGPSLRGP